MMACKRLRCASSDDRKDWRHSSSPHTTLEKKSKKPRQSVAVKGEGESYCVAETFPDGTPRGVRKYGESCWTVGQSG